jgi:integrase
MPRLTQTIADTYDGRDGEIIWDSGKGGVTGLGLRVRDGGSRKWVFQYRLAGISRRLTIGDASAWRLDAARSKARTMRVNVDNGVDPSSEKASRREAARLTLGSIVAEHLETRQRNMRPRSFLETTRHLRTHWAPLHKLPIANITRAIVAARLREIAKINGPFAADRARSSLSAAFGWAIGEGLCESNPVTGTNRTGKDEPRDRTLSDDELAAIWRAAPDNDYGRIVKLLILTAARRDEIGSMRWSEIDLEKRTVTLPAARTKNKRQHVVPLSDLATEVVENVGRRAARDFVFGRRAAGYGGWGHSKINLDAKLKIAPWRLHDIRRTVRTGMGKLGVQPHIAEAVLNHLPAKLIRTYDTNTYEREKRMALDLWAAHVSGLIIGTKSEVVTLRRSKAAS